MLFELVWSNKIHMYVLVSSSIPYCVLCSCFHFPFFPSVSLSLLSLSYFSHSLFFHLFSFYGVSDGKESACSAGDLGSIPGSGRYREEGNGYPLHYSCLENPMDRGAWWATVRGVAKSWTPLSG